MTKKKKSMFNGHAVICPEKLAQIDAADAITKAELTTLDEILKALAKLAKELAEEDTDDCIVNMPESVKERVLAAKLAYNKLHKEE